MCAPRPSVLHSSVSSRIRLCFAVSICGSPLGHSFAQSRSGRRLRRYTGEFPRVFANTSREDKPAEAAEHRRQSDYLFRRRSMAALYRRKHISVTPDGVLAKNSIPVMARRAQFSKEKLNKFARTNLLTSLFACRRAADHICFAAHICTTFGAILCQWTSLLTKLRSRCGVFLQHENAKIFLLPQILGIVVSTTVRIQSFQYAGMSFKYSH